MTAKNNVPETEEMEVRPTGLPSDEVVAMTQEELVSGLLAAAGYETDEQFMKDIEIRRNGRLFFKFKVHPLGEKELMRIRKLSSKTYNNPGGKGLPKIQGDPAMDEFRSRKIYAATADDDKVKLWDNPQVKAGLKAQGKSIIEEWEIVDAVLLAGEKFRISELIDEISGYTDEDVELEEYAKN